MGSKNFTVYWSKTAQDDLVDIINYIESDNLSNAENVFHKIKTESLKLESFPGRRRIVPELANQNIFNYRELVSHPWRLIYRIDENKIYVLAVIDGRRNIEDIILKRIMRD